VLICVHLPHTHLSFCVFFVILTFEIEVVVGINVHLYLCWDCDGRVLLVELLLEVFHIEGRTFTLGLGLVCVFFVLILERIKFGVFFVDLGLVSLNSN